MASQYIRELQSTRSKLVGQLVTSLVGVDADDENHGIAVEFCLQNLDYHRFGDTNPGEVHREYAGLEKRLWDGGHLEKAQILHALRARFLGLPLDSDYSDLHDGVLGLLLELADKPQESELGDVQPILDLLYSTNAATTKLPPQSFARHHGNQAAQDAGAESDGESYGCSDASELSDWSDHGEDAEPAVLPPSSMQPQQATPQQHASPRKHHQPSTPAIIQPHDQPLVLPGPPLPSVIPELQPDHIEPQPSDTLYQIHHLQNNFNVLVGHCYSESFITSEVLTLLQGSPCHLATLANGCLMVNPQVCSTRVSHGAMQQVLKQYACAGTRARYIEDVCTAIRSCSSRQQAAAQDADNKASSTADDASAVGSIPLLNLLPASKQLCADVIITPVLRAFAAAVQQQLQQVREHATTMQQHILSGQLQCSMLELRRLCTGSIQALEHLGFTCSTVVSRLAAQPCTAADVSTLVLDTLLEQLKHQDNKAGGAAEGERSRLLHLMLASAVPYLDALEVWLYQGHVNEFAPDFFMQSNSTACLQDPGTWYQGYQLSSSTAGLDVPCPSFLKPMLDSIIKTGKSLRLLYHINRSEAAEEAKRRLPLRWAGTEEGGSIADVNIDLEFDLDFDQEGSWEHDAPEADGSEQHCLASVMCQQLQGLLQHAQEQMQQVLQQVLVAQQPQQQDQPAQQRFGVISKDLSDLAAAASRACRQVDGPSALMAMMLEGHVWEELEISTQPAGSTVELAAAAEAAEVVQLQQQAAAGKEQDAQSKQPSPRSVLDLADVEEQARRAGADGAEATARRKWSSGSSSSSSSEDGQAEQQEQEQQREAGAAVMTAGKQEAIPQQASEPDTSAVSDQQQTQPLGKLQDVNPHLQWYQQMLSEMQHGGLQPVAHVLEHPAEPAPAPAQGAADGTELLLQGLWPLKPLTTEMPEVGSGIQAGSGSQQGSLIASNGAIELEQVLQQAAGPCVPAVDFMMQEALHAVLRPRVEAVSHTLLGCLLSPWGLMKELLVLRNVFLLASPAMNNFVDGFVRLLLDQPSMDRISEHQLEDLLAESFSQAALDEMLPDTDSMTLVIDGQRLKKITEAQVKLEGQARGNLKSQAEEYRMGTGDEYLAVSARLHKDIADIEAAHAAAGRPLQHESGHAPGLYGGGIGDMTQLTFVTMDVVDAVRLRYSSTWLTGMMADPQMDRIYSGALGFILKLRYAKAMLTRSTQHLWKQRRHIQYPRLSKASSMRQREAAEVPRSSSSLPLPFSNAAAVTGSRGSSQGQQLAAGKKLGPGGTVPPPAAVQFGAYDEVMALHEMITVMDNLQEYVMEQLQQVAWPAFERKLEQCTSLDEVRACHKELLSTVSKVCFMELPQQQAEQQGQRPLGNRARCSAMIKHMMHHTLQFCYLQQRGSGRAELNMGEQQSNTQHARQVLLRKLRMAWHQVQFRRTYSVLCRQLDVLAVRASQYDLRTLLAKLDCNGWASTLVAGKPGEDLQGAAL